MQYTFGYCCKYTQRLKTGFVLQGHVSVKARNRKIDISIDWPLYILGYKYVAM